ncbi:CPBP family intramembrane glutamic endopeptidase [Streptomyces sp. NPDC001678]|uniref:CPBP family intramembrane glutamic endopeptidase n=1 Tax=Streptomyces sp. NPDC001678 TaxID=3364599 RepID=UPI0036950564
MGSPSSASRARGTRAPRAARDWCLVVAGFLLAFGLSSAVAVQILLTGHIDLPDRAVRHLPGMKAGFLVAAVAMALAHRWLGHSAADLGLAARPRHRFPYGGLGAAGAAYLGMWTGFEVMRLFPSPGYAPTGRTGAGEQLLANLHSALVEETLLLALPMAVMTRLLWPWWAQLAVLTALRVPFHLYYGYGAFALCLIWMGGYLLVYRRTRIVWPFMLAHFVYNSAHADYLPTVLRPLLGLAFWLLGALALVRLARDTKWPSRRPHG